MEVTLSTMGMPYTINSYLIQGLEVCALESSNMIVLSTVYTKDTIPVSKGFFPNRKDLEKWEHLSDLDIPLIEEEITMLIGNNVPDAYSPIDTITGPRGSPHAVKTLLGWVVWNLMRGSGSESLSVNTVDIIAIHEQEELKYLDFMVREAINYDFPEKVIDDRRELSRENIFL